jgi:hypothetical protein
MFANRVLHWFVYAQLLLSAASSPTLAFQGHFALPVVANVDSFVVKIGGRKGTRNYTPDDAGATTEPKDADSSAETEARNVRLENCMASWDSKTHITKSSWRKICERQLSDQ